MARRHDIRLTLTDLTLSRGERTLIRDLNLSLEPGDTLWLTGPNGIGKTTLLLACAGLLRPDGGSVIWSRGNSALSAPESVAYAAHSGPERNGLKLGEELAFWQSLYKDPNPMRDRLEQVGLAGREATPVAGLSAGQRRRLSLARLLSSNRAAWSMDEPLSGLDEEGRSLVRAALGDHLSWGGIAIIASHQPVPIPDMTARKLVLEPGT